MTIPCCFWRLYRHTYTYNSGSKSENESEKRAHIENRIGSIAAITLLL